MKNKMKLFNCQTMETETIYEALENVLFLVKVKVENFHNEDFFFLVNVETFASEMFASISVLFVLWQTDTKNKTLRH